MGWVRVLAEIEEQRRAREADKALRAAREKALQERDMLTNGLISRLRDYSPENRAHVVHEAADELAALRERVAELEAALRRVIDLGRDMPDEAEEVRLARAALSAGAVQTCVQCEGHGKVYGANSMRAYECENCSGTGKVTVLRQGTSHE